MPVAKYVLYGTNLSDEMMKFRAEDLHLVVLGREGYEHSLPVSHLSIHNSLVGDLDPLIFHEIIPGR